jgi:hypothetical protein
LYFADAREEVFILMKNYCSMASFNICILFGTAVAGGIDSSLVNFGNTVAAIDPATLFFIKDLLELSIFKFLNQGK